MPRDQILAKVHRVGMVPMALAEDFKDRSDLQTRYEQLLTERLQKLGWEIVPAARYATERESFVKQLGGTFDPITGEEIKERVVSTRQHVLGVLDAERRVDAILTPAIVPRPADFRDGDAK